VARKLTAGVVLRRPGSGGQVVFLPAGSDLPGWAVSLVGDHVLTPVDASEWQPDPDGVDWPDLDETDPASSWSPDGAAAAVPAAPADPPPPKAGSGSSRARWLAYADTHGVTVDADATRADIIAALHAAGVPTD